MQDLKSYVFREMDKSESVSVKVPSSADLHRLLELIKLSTSCETNLTLEGLKQAIFETQQPNDPPSVEDDSCFEFELKSIRSNKPVAQALVAEMKGQLVGYIIAHYHYSPWIGHGMNIDDIYVMRDLHNRGVYQYLDTVERKLIGSVMAFAKQENLSVLFFDSDKKEFDFMRGQCKWYRNNKDCDWSLLQISK